MPQLPESDDYVTVNITCDQAAALAFVLITAGKYGIIDMLPREEGTHFRSFVETMMIEIDRQKLGALDN